MPRYDEFSVEKVYKLFQNDEDFLRYMPDPEKNLNPDRAFMFGIIGTMHEDWLNNAIE